MIVLYGEETFGSRSLQGFSKTLSVRNFLFFLAWADRCRTQDLLDEAEKKGGGIKKKKNRADKVFENRCKNHKMNKTINTYSSVIMNN